VVSFIPEPTITSFTPTQFYYTLLDIVNVTVTGTNLGFNRDNGGSVFVKVDNTVITVSPIALSDTTFVFTVPLGLDIGPHDIFISTDGRNYRAPNGAVKQINVLLCPPGTFCRFNTSTICDRGYFCPQNRTFEPVKCPAG
jgi:IPT/TIG domain